MKPGAIVVFESTVYPGVTENVCGPLLEKHSGLKRGVDFKLGYSPERINPGDKQHRLETITKIIAAEDVESLARVKAVYGAIVTAGLYEAQSIKVAEAAKVLVSVQELKFRSIVGPFRHSWPTSVPAKKQKSLCFSIFLANRRVGFARPDLRNVNSWTDT